MGDYVYATGQASTAMGKNTSASGNSSTAMGNYTEALGFGSTAMGYNTRASASMSTSMGDNTEANGIASTAMGIHTSAQTLAQVAIGQYNKDYGTSSNGAGNWVSTDPLFVIGNGSSATTRSDAMVVLKDARVGINMSNPTEMLHVNGNILSEQGLFGSNLEIINNSGNVLNTQGLNVGIGGINPSERLEVFGNVKADSLIGDGSQLTNLPNALEFVDEGNGNGIVIRGRDANSYGDVGYNALDLSYSTGNSTTHGATGDFSMSMGYNAKSSGDHSTAMGFAAKALDNFSTAIGLEAEASGMYSNALGGKTLASGNYSNAMGYLTIAAGSYSTSMGNSTDATGNYSTAMGYNTYAKADYSTAMGRYTDAQSFTETVIGQYNTSYTPNSNWNWNSSDRLFVIGNGTSSNAKSDAIVVLKNGNTGIGLSLPTEKLEVDGNIKATAIFSDSLQVNGSSIMMENNQVSPALSVMKAAGASSGDVLSIAAGQSSVENMLEITDGNGYVNDIFVVKSNNGSNFGGVGIGTGAPLSDLHIQQSTGSGPNQGTAGINLSSAISPIAQWRIYNSWSYIRFNYSSDGGLTYAPKAYIKDSDGSYNQVSDATMKKDIKPLDNVLSKVKALEPLEYRYIDNADNAPLSMGFFAQDVQKIFPTTVSSEEGESLLGIDYSKFAVISIKAIQEQQDLIEEQNNRIDALEQLVQELLNR
tara:strand:- start:127 stop:2235 length:2109 start_codon:yes stop_codon:yes gene_type:complete